MLNPDQALQNIPDSLRNPLLAEFSEMLNSFMERRWTAAELSGGRFCEIIYSILDGYAKNRYPSAVMKPRNFVASCRGLENNSGIPRSFQILIPRLLPALYEIRNNRNVGHVSGDVDPDFMDSSAVVSMASWIMAELIRVSTALSRMLIPLRFIRTSQAGRCAKFRRMFIRGFSNGKFSSDAS